MTADQFDKIAVFADDDRSRAKRGLKYFEVGCIPQPDIPHGDSIYRKLFRQSFRQFGR